MPFPHRLAAAGAALAACLAAFAVLLWDIQVTNGPAYAARAQRSIAQMETVPAARGRLLDRNGTVLVQDQVTWQAQVDQEADPAVPASAWPPSAGRRGWPGPAQGLWRKSPPACWSG